MISESYLNQNSQFYQVIKDQANISIENYTALPIVIDKTVHYIVMLCNKRHLENAVKMTVDETKIA